MKRSMMMVLSMTMVAAPLALAHAQAMQLDPDKSAVKSGSLGSSSAQWQQPGAGSMGQPATPGSMGAQSRAPSIDAPARSPSMAQPGSSSPGIQQQPGMQNPSMQQRFDRNNANPNPGMNAPQSPTMAPRGGGPFDSTWNAPMGGVNNPAQPNAPIGGVNTAPTIQSPSVPGTGAPGGALTGPGGSMGR